MSKTVLTKTMSFSNAGNWLSIVPLGVGVRGHRAVPSEGHKQSPPKRWR